VQKPEPQSFQNKIEYQFALGRYVQYAKLNCEPTYYKIMATRNPSKLVGWRCEVGGLVVTTAETRKAAVEAYNGWKQS
jgi:hypothetical protein